MFSKILKLQFAKKRKACGSWEESVGTVRGYCVSFPGDENVLRLTVVVVVLLCTV